MTRKAIHQQFLLLATLAALILASCSKEEMDGRSDMQNEEIRFEIGFAPTDDSMQTSFATRVATDTKFRSIWEDGDAIGIFAVENGSALATTSNLIHNVKLTYSSRGNGTWTAAEPLYWPMNGKKLDFYAYYPYDETLTDPLAITFSVPTDQSAMTAGTSVYNRNDILMAKTGNKDKSEIVALDFSHALAMVQVNVSKSMVGNYAPETLIVRLNGCATGCVLNLSTQTIAQPSEPLTETIKMYPCPNDDVPGVFAYRALMPAQTIAAGTVMFSSEYDGSRYLHSKPLAQALTLTAGQAETFDMTFPFTSVTVSETKRLGDLLTADELASIRHLKVLGEMTAADFSTIRNQMTSIINLDLGGATVRGNAIPDDALYKKEGLEQFIFPQGITSIGKSAFYNCRGLTGSLKIPNEVTTIGQYAFCNCTGFTGSLKIPEGVQTISTSTFIGCTGFNELIIPKGVTTIGAYAFYECTGFTGLLKIPNEVTTIGQYAFCNCTGFTGSLKIPEGVQTISTSTFIGCTGFNELIIPKGVTTIDRYAFYECTGFTGLLKIPEGVQTIGYSAFFKTGFNELTIPASITMIDYAAFALCTSVTSITCHIPNPTNIEFGDAVFDHVPRNIPVYVPPASVANYRSHAIWKRFNNIQAITPP